MNKITVVKDKILIELEQSGLMVQEHTIEVQQDAELLLVVTDSTANFTFHIEEGKKLDLSIKSQNSENTLYYELKKNSILCTHHLALDCTDQIDARLLGEESNLEYHYSTMNRKTSALHMTIDHAKSNTQSNVQNHGVNLKDQNLLFDITGRIPKSSHGCICNQDNKILTMQKGHSRIEPKLLIENHDVEANHAAYLGQFKEEELFYLMSRGISKEKCYELLLEGFLLNHDPVDRDTHDWFFRFMIEK